MVALAVAAIGLFFSRGWHRFKNAPRRPIVFLPEIAIVLAMTMYLLGPIGAAIAARFYGVSPPPPTAEYALDDQAKLVLGTYLGQSIVLVVLIGLTMKAGRASTDSRPGWIKASLIGAGTLLLALPLILASAAVASVVASLVRGQAVDPIAHETLRMFIREPVDGWYIAFGAMVILIAPIMEEVLYRGLVQRTLVQVGLPRWWAIILTSLAFALMHMRIVDIYVLPALFVLSLGFGWAYEKTGRISASITMHILFNAANLAVALLTSSPTAT